MQPSSLLAACRRDLIAHPLVSALRGGRDWRIFMEYHVFAVWDFMSLLKRLQRELTCVQIPWRPAAVPRFTRLINEIVLAEESDDDGEGGHCSHFELYLRAMRAAGADTARVAQFLAHLDEAGDIEAALQHAPAEAEAFVRQTLSVAHRGTLPEVCAAFLWGREALIPDLFTTLVSALEGQGPPIQPLRYYLTRHIELDGGAHGALAQELLATVCHNDPALYVVAERAAVQSLRDRHALWTGIHSALRRS